MEHRRSNNLKSPQFRRARKSVPGGGERCFGSPSLHGPARVRSVVLFVAAPGTSLAESVVWAGPDYCTPCRPFGATEAAAVRRRQAWAYRAL